MDEKIHLITEPEELFEWMKEHDIFYKMNDKDAELLLNYMEGHDYRLGTDKDGNLLRVDVNHDEYESEPYTMDDAIDTVCEWNYEFIRETETDIENTDDEKGRKEAEARLSVLKQEEISLDRLFNQTRFSEEIEALAMQLADKFVERLNTVGVEKAVDELEEAINENTGRGR